MSCMTSVLPSTPAPCTAPLPTVLSRRSLASASAAAAPRATNTFSMSGPSSLPSTRRPATAPNEAASSADCATAAPDARPRLMLFGSTSCCAARLLPTLGRKLMAAPPTAPPTRPGSPARAPSLAPANAPPTVAPSCGPCSARNSGVCRPTSPRAPSTPFSLYASLTSPRPVCCAYFSPSAFWSARACAAAASGLSVNACAPRAVLPVNCSNPLANAAPKPFLGSGLTGAVPASGSCASTREISSSSVAPGGALRT